MSSTFEKAYVITDPDARDRWSYDGSHGDRCQICLKPWIKTGWRGFAVHHIIHGANGRSDEPCNFLLVCSRCHDMIHAGGYRDEKTKKLLPTITLGNVLWVKLIMSDCSECDEVRLTALYHRNLPPLDVLPDYYLAERERWTREVR